MGFRSRLMSLCTQHGKQSLHDSLPPILMKNQELRALALIRVLVLAPFHITLASEDEQPPSFKLRKDEGEFSSSCLHPLSSPIPHNLLLASLPTTFPQSRLLLIHSITHGKILIFFFPRLNTPTSPETPPGGGDSRLPITQPAERQWEAGAGNYHISQFVSLEPPWLPALIPCFAGLKTSPRVVLCQRLGRAANPQHRSWRKDFPFIPTGNFWPSKGQGIITGQ